MSTYLQKGNWHSFDLDTSPGVSVYTAPWLHAREIAAIGSDNYAVEVRPSESPPFRSPFHICAIPNMGLTLGEIFYLEELGCRLCRGWTLRVSPGGATATGDQCRRHADQPVCAEVGRTLSFAVPSPLPEGERLGSGQMLFLDGGLNL